MTYPLYNWYQHQSAKLAYRRGCARIQQQAYNQAIAAFTQALSMPSFLGEQRSRAIVNRGISYLEIGERDAAIADFESIIGAASLETCSDVEPAFTLAQAHYYRGLLRQTSGNEAGALADWSIAIAYQPTYPEPYYQRALIHLSQSQYEQALSDLDTAIDTNPAFTPAYLQRGNLRHQLKDIPGAVADWEIAVCNDFSLEEAKQKLASVHQAAYDAKLTQKLSAALSKKNLTAKVTHSEGELSIHIYRQLGTGINYYTLPDLIREQLSPLHLANVIQFQLIGHLADVNCPEWNQSYDLYKNEACPPSNWQAAFSTLVVFPPFGIPAFIQAAQVKRFYNRGQYLESLSASKSVKGLCIAGSVTLGFIALMPLGYAAYDSMKEEPTFQIAQEEANISVEKQSNLERKSTHRPYHEMFNESELN